MAATIKQHEEQPEAYPAAPEGLSTAAAALADTVWQRIEAYVAHRWSPRDVIWTVEGPGHWEPPLAPATVTKAEVWRGEAWQELTLPPSPWGGFKLGGEGPYRFTATVGEAEADVPGAVLEAFKRLAEYLAAKPGKPGARTESISAGSISLRHSRHEAWAARAMMNSGAGDLLRPYRRAK